MRPGRRQSNGAIRASGVANAVEAGAIPNKRREYPKEDVKLLRAHSKARTPVARVSKLMKRSEGSLRQKARVLGIGLGHQR